MDDSLEQVFSKGHELHERIFYDRYVGQYYDRGTDLYLEQDDLKRFGIS